MGTQVLKIVPTISIVSEILAKLKLTSTDSISNLKTEGNKT